MNSKAIKMFQKFRNRSLCLTFYLLKMKKNQQLSWNDYLFENRHKAYGAYELRTEEGNNLLKSLLLVGFFVGILVTVLSFTSKDTIEEGTTTYCPIDVNVDFTEEIEPPVSPPSVTPKVIPTATVENKDSDIIPEPKEKPEVEKPLTEQKDIGKLVMPEVGNAGNEGIIKSTGNIGNSGTGENTGTKEPEVIKEVKSTFSPREVTKMAVFPGCEKVGNSKKALQDCMAEKLSGELGIQLDGFGELAKKENIHQASAKLNFIVDKSGKIIEVKAMNGGNQAFGKEAQQALKRISDRLVKKGKYLEPAELDDGSKVNMSFTIPVQFNLN